MNTLDTCKHLKNCNMKCMISSPGLRSIHFLNSANLVQEMAVINYADGWRVGL